MSHISTGGGASLELLEGLVRDTSLHASIRNQRIHLHLHTHTHTHTHTHVQVLPGVAALDSKGGKGGPVATGTAAGQVPGFMVYGLGISRIESEV